MVAGVDELRAQLTRFPFVVLLFAPLLACNGRGDASPARTLLPQSAGVVDSGLPLEEALRRFREGLPVVASLENGEASRAALVRRFIRAVERSDTNKLRALAMSRAEFAYLYYPTSPHTRAPTRQAPDLVWFLHIQHSQKGVTRALNRHGGRPLHFLDFACTSPPRRAGANAVWDDCVMRLREGTDTVPVRMFGGIIEREGRFKIFSYSNDF